MSSGRHVFAVRPDWKALQISPDLWLSHCPKLPIFQLTSKDGRNYWLIGHAVLCDAATSIADAIRHTNSSDVTSWTARWAGHWVLVSDRDVLPDASGSIGTYYREDPRWALDFQQRCDPRQPVCRDYIVTRRSAIPLGAVQHRLGWDWIPTPLTGREGVGKLPLRCAASTLLAAPAMLRRMIGREALRDRP